MPSKPLDPATIQALLAPKVRRESTAGVKPQFILPPQRGPARYSEKEQKCVNSGYYAVDPETHQRFYKKSHGRCASPTHWTYKGVPYCTVHMLQHMNEDLMELTGEGRTEERDVDGNSGS